MRRCVLAFQIAAHGAFREGMKSGKCKIAEPVMQALSPSPHLK